MFNSELLEVVIGLVFIYLLLSLLTTAVNEIIARAIALRSGTLVDGVKKFMENPDEFYNHPLIKVISPVEKKDSKKKDGNEKKDKNWKFWTKFKGNGKPSYIAPKTFATAAMDTLFARVDEGKIKEMQDYLGEIHQKLESKESQIPEDLRKSLLLALADAEDKVPTISAETLKKIRKTIGELSDPDVVVPFLNGLADEKKREETLKDIREEIGTFPKKLRTPLLLALDDAADEIAAVTDKVTVIKEQLEKSFDEVMDRVRGWYKRKTQLISILVGLGVALAANADTIAIANAMMRDATLRDAIVASAEQAAAQDEADLTSNIDDLQNQLLETQVLGWITPSDESTTAPADANLDPRAMPVKGDVGGWFLKVFGWAITAFAVSLGAPFWFDVLSKVTSIRATGKPPKEEEPQQDVNVQIKTKSPASGS